MALEFDASPFDPEVGQFGDISTVEEFGSSIPLDTAWLDQEVPSVATPPAELDAPLAFASGDDSRSDHSDVHVDISGLSETYSARSSSPGADLHRERGLKRKQAEAAKVSTSVEAAREKDKKLRELECKPFRTEDEDREFKRLKRLGKKKASAAASRERRKAFMSDLEKKVLELSATNSDLVRRVAELERENKLLRRRAGLGVADARLSKRAQNVGKAGLLLAVVFCISVTFRLPGVKQESNDTQMSLERASSLLEQVVEESSAKLMTEGASEEAPLKRGRQLLSVDDEPKKEASSGVVVDRALDARQTLLVVLLEKFCSNYGTSPKLFNVVCHRLYELGILDNIEFLHDMGSLRSLFASYFGSVEVKVSDAVEGEGDGRRVAQLSFAGDSRNADDDWVARARYVKQEKKAVPAPLPGARLMSLLARHTEEDSNGMVVYTPSRDDCNKHSVLDWKQAIVVGGSERGDSSMMGDTINLLVPMSVVDEDKSNDTHYLEVECKRGSLFSPTPSLQSA
eukprot:CAMPEP_0113903420 /NCGR_PEP_ID=MMETSP0780_2-20120614/22522_1 /TAXON_ID=652834 /ORGANISM="Palpitomonas bilix" /LENGTH=513 /DNA_ID=CAMNT_0000896587 /DNA_START=45 /DNA_END=1587 /DNA_ORIENTATION=+ /assembly_acc=CAM_ASM_000599